MRRSGRVPFLQQLNAVECGTACLAMILTYYGRKTSVAECRKICDAGRDGVSAKTIAQAARAYGLRVKAFSLEPASLKYIQLPAIVHWTFNHFVVLEKWAPGNIVVVDPAEGRRNLTDAEFAEGFTGVILSLEPGTEFLRGHQPRKAFWLQYLQAMVRIPGIPCVLAQILFASLVMQFSALAVTLFTKVLIDQVIPFQMTSILHVLGAGMVCIASAQALTGYLRSSFLIYLRGRLDSELMLGFFEHLLALPFRYFQERASGDLLMRLGSNNLIREVLTNQTLSVIFDALLVFFYLVIFLIQAPRFGIAVLALGLLELLILCGTRRRTERLLQRELAAEAEEQGYVVEVLKSMPMVKASGAEDQVIDRWSNLFFKQLNISLERNHSMALIEMALGAVRTLSPLLLLWLGAALVLNASISLGTMMALIALASAFLTPLSALVAGGQQLQLVGAHLERIADVLTAQPEESSARTAITITGRIDVKNVTFRYGPNSGDILHDVSFSVEAGQKIAVVGRTGSGKSTLAMLLLGLYQPTHGEILYDGTRLSDLNYRSLRRQIGVVLQESLLFSGSIRQNIAVNDRDVSLDEIIRVSRLACIDDDIHRMPLGYDTPVAENGTTLSGGQRQCLSIARALLRRPVILLLDEATSHLDVLTEQRIDGNLNALSCTRIVIAHRLSTIRDADKILVLDQGRIVEQGTHEELQKKNGIYADLLSSQFKKQNEELYSGGCVFPRSTAL